LGLTAQNPHQSSFHTASRSLTLHLVHFEVEFLPLSYCRPTRPLVHTIDARGFGLIMEVGAGGSSHDASNWSAMLENVGAKGKGSAKRQPKDAKTKQSPNAPGTRYQCPRCPKNFSRIENLTRHQANRKFFDKAGNGKGVKLILLADEDVGKFACVICRKRFTRSDLLNRHRKIHGNQVEALRDHVTQSDDFSESPQSDTLGPGNLAGRDSRYLSQETSSNPSNDSPQYPYQNQVPQRHGLYGQQDAYRQPIPSSNPSAYQQPPGQAQGLTSLMEAALAPQETFSFTPLENINPSLWDGFMVFGDNANSYMGSYDADISWTLNHFQSDGSPNMLLDHELMDFVENPYQQPQPPIPPYNQNQQPINEYPPVDPDADADAEDDDQNDWPDKVSRPSTPHKHAQRVVPLGLNSESQATWVSVVDEARSGLSQRSIRPYQQLNDQIRASILSTLNSFSFVRNDFSRREVSDRVFPPSEALDYYLRLYFQYIQPRFPIIHLPSFNIYSCPPLLLLAMMFLGSSHSKADRGRFLRLFHEHLRVACIRMQEMDQKFVRFHSLT
jgi:hypothetical protein